MLKFINGLPEKLAFYVRSSNKCNIQPTTTIMVQNHKVHLTFQPFVIIVIARGTSRNTAIGMDEEMCIKISIVNYVVKKGI
jgi:hypothetical protein